MNEENPYSESYKQSGGGGSAVLFVVFGLLASVGIVVALVFVLLTGFANSDRSDKSDKPDNVTAAKTKAARNAQDNNSSVPTDKTDNLSPNSTTSGNTTEPTDPKTSSEPSSDELKGEFTNVTPIRVRSGSIYFIGIYKNTGSGPMRTPKVTVNLLDGEGSLLKKARGYGMKSQLLPGESTPVRIIVSRPPDYQKYQIKHEPRKPYFVRKRVKIKIVQGKVSTIRIGYRAKGVVRNEDTQTARHVKIIATLFDEKKNLVAAGYGYIKQKQLAPRERAEFSFTIYPSKGKAKSFKMDYSATSK